eukprot:CAMPEP_0198662928 /NCGR_PEP_ID=MMETSP1467-20131203/49710_1 /TAXON_ID=1462469 /ORGANISM="unid. sp., Strain CCMP2135" /LENGTH=387 /DNA_ID=CAMNT_0044399431 /DNA_START=40 /DNA_END=1199 /DNA_ORIENTATION=-
MNGGGAFLQLQEPGEPLLKQQWVSQDGFSLGERLAKRVEPRWQYFKEKGNKALRGNDAKSAIGLYSKALFVATTPFSQMRTLRDIAEASPEAPMRLALELDDVMVRVFQYLPLSPRRNVKLEVGPVKVTYSLPNLPAAIALSNRATAHAKLGDYARSREDAELAAQYCPEFVRAHEKLEVALRQLGESAEAERVEREIADYKRLCRMQAWTGPALLMSGWIDHFTLQQYERERQAAVVPHLQACHYVYGAISLVPFQGGQWMFFNLRFRDDKGLPRKVDLFSFCPADNRNEDMLEELPHGKASPKALQHVPQLTNSILTQLRDLDVKVSTLTCGQGLVDQVDLLRRHLGKDILVAPAISTRVSEDAGLDHPLSAMMRNLGIDRSALP